MASIRRQDDSFEIRECLATDRGPRQRPLARFRGVLTPDILDAAAAAARRPFDRQAVLERARRQGIPVSLERHHPEARKLLARLRSGQPLDPALVGQLRNALELLASEPVPIHLQDVAQWVGQGEAVRGKALRGLLRTASRILRSRGPLRAPPHEPFPRFSSGGEPRA